jgi:cytochrome P450
MCPGDDHHVTCFRHGPGSSMTATASAVGGLNGDDALAALFFTENGMADPAPLYHHLRTTAPVHYSGTGAIFLSRFDDCDLVLRDNRFGKAQGSDDLVPQGDEAAVRFRREWRERLMADGRAQSMLFLDPPQHTRQRRLVARAFTPMRVEALRGSIRALAQKAVGALVAAGGGDVLETVGFRLR